jgi:hypothetical protein
MKTRFYQECRTHHASCSLAFPVSLLAARAKHEKGKDSLTVVQCKHDSSPWGRRPPSALKVKVLEHPNIISKDSLSAWSCQVRVCQGKAEYLEVTNVALSELLRALPLTSPAGLLPWVRAWGLPTQPATPGEQHVLPDSSREGPTGLAGVSAFPGSVPQTEDGYHEDGGARVTCIQESDQEVLLAQDILWTGTDRAKSPVSVLYHAICLYLQHTAYFFVLKGFFFLFSQKIRNKKNQILLNLLQSNSKQWAGTGLLALNWNLKLIGFYLLLNDFSWASSASQIERQRDRKRERDR